MAHRLATHEPHGATSALPELNAVAWGGVGKEGTLPQQTSTPAQQVKRTRPQATPSDGTENGHRARPRLLATVRVSRLLYTGPILE
jgi:hypothetical protein